MGSTVGLPRSGIYAVKSVLSAWSTPVFAQMPTRPSGPAAPSGVSASGALQSIVVTWSKPTTHADGSALKLGELAGFWIYWSDASGIDPTDPTSYDGKEWVNSERYVFTVPDPSSYLGPYYFAVQAVDSEGNASSLSSEVSATASGNTGVPDTVQVDDWSTGNAESIIVGRERIFIKLRLPKSSWVRFSHYNIYYDVDTGGGFSGTWTYLASEVVGFMHSPLDETYAYKYRVTVVGEDGTETTGTIHDNSGAGYTPNQSDQSNLLADTLAAQHIVAAYDITARTLYGGTLQSLNWGASAGTQIDLDNEAIRLGGSGVGYNSGTGIWMGNDAGTYKLFIGDSAGNKLIFDGAGLTLVGSVTITGGSGIANLSDAGALATLDVVGTAQIDDLAVTTAKIADLAVTNAKVSSLDASKITTGTLDAARIGAGTITADKLSVSTLSAITADMGTLTAGQISVAGGLVKIGEDVYGTYDGIYVGSGGTIIIQDSSGSTIFDSSSTFQGARVIDGDYIYNPTSAYTIVKSWTSVTVPSGKKWIILATPWYKLIYQTAMNIGVLDDIIIEYGGYFTVGGVFYGILSAGTYSTVNAIVYHKGQVKRDDGTTFTDYGSTNWIIVEVPI